jgi:ketosteroid isomerase-like protein
MKQRLLTISLPAAVVVAMSSCGTSSGPATSSSTASNVEQAVTQLENERVPALLRGDTAFIERVYADDYVVTGANGVVRTRAQVIADMKSGAQTFESMKNDGLKVRAYGDTAIVTGRTTQKGQYKGQASLSPTQFTRVYVRRDGRWQLVANSSSVFTEVE